MKTHRFVLGFFGFLVSLTTQAQEEKTNPVSVSEVQVHSGMNYSPLQMLAFPAMNPFAPGSEILAKDYSNFNSFSSTTYAHPSLSAFLGLTLKNHPNMLLRTGLSYGNRTYFSGGKSKQETFPYDTLTSSQTGEQYYLDSSRYTYMNMNQTAELFGLDLSLIYRTDPEARWSLYGGLGLNFSFAFNVFTNLNYGSWSTVPSYNGESSSIGEYLYEQYRNESFLASTLYLPMGLDFRIGKRREFWNRIHLIYELKPAMSLASIPEYGNITQFNFTHGLGLRVTW